MELLVKINKKLEQRRAILNTIIQNVGIQNKILKSAQILAECLKLGGKIITAGNGGSASQSEHFSSEMMGRLKNSRTPFPSLSLSSNASLLTCIGNDFGFERIFSRQIEGIGTTKDVFIAFTTSCKSRLYTFMFIYVKNPADLVYVLSVTICKTIFDPQRG